MMFRFFLLLLSLFLPLLAHALMVEGLYVGFGAGFGQSSGYKLNITATQPVAESTDLIKGFSDTYIMGSGPAYQLYASLGGVVSKAWAFEAELGYRKTAQNAQNSSEVKTEDEQGTFLGNVYLFVPINKDVDFYGCVGMGFAFFNGNGQFALNGSNISNGDRYTMMGLYYNALQTTWAGQGKMGAAYRVNSAMLISFDAAVFVSSDVNDTHDIGRYVALVRTGTNQSLAIDSNGGNIGIKNTGAVDVLLSVNVKFFFAT